MRDETIGDLYDLVGEAGSVERFGMVWSRRIPPEQVIRDRCGECGHDMSSMTYGCGWGSIDEQPFCHPNEPGHPDCYTIACRRLHR